MPRTSSLQEAAVRGIKIKKDTTFTASRQQAVFIKGYCVRHGKQRGYFPRYYLPRPVI